VSSSLRGKKVSRLCCKGVDRSMTLEYHEQDVMRYVDREMDAPGRMNFERHLESCESCRTALEEMTALKEVTDTMKIAELPEAVWEKYWTSIYNKVERSVAWFFFIIGSIIVSGYSIYRMIVDPGIDSILRLGIVLTVIGAAILFLSVLREKMAVNRKDRYISEVDR